MALFGTQLVITMVMASMLQKLGPHYSIARWLLCSTGLVRYVFPTDEDIKSLLESTKEKSTKSKKRRDNNPSASEDGTFMVPRNLDIQLESTKVTPVEVIQLHFYAEYQWLVDFAMCASIVYTLTEIYYGLLPAQDEVNLSMLWCLLVVGFTLKVLVGQTALYFRGEEASGERSLCIMMGCSYLLLAMIILIVDESILELGLEQAYAQFNHTATLFLEDQGPEAVRGPASKLIIKFTFAVWCGFIGGLFTFPGLRLSRMHWDSLRYCKGSVLLSAALNISFIAPFLVVILWVKPIARDYLTARIFSGMEAPIMTEPAFDALRFVCIVGVVALRVLLMPYYLQSYLNIAHDKIEAQKKEAGRISNKEIQKKVAHVYYYLCVIAVQYVAPIILCLFLALMYKTMGGYSWISSWHVEEAKKCPFVDPVKISSILPDDDSISSAASHFSLTINSLKQVFTVEVYRGLFGFATWWTCFSLFATSGLGVIYRSYFDKI